MEKGNKGNNKKRGNLFNIQPWQKLLIYLFMILVTGCIYWGWNGIQELLYKAGAYEKLCEDADETTTIKIGNEEYIDCGARKSGINNLFTVAYSSHFITSVFTGLFVDLVGAKCCFAIGQLVNLSVWILIGFMPKSNCVLLFSFFLIGATAEMLYMPLMSISYNFPSKRSFVISVMGATRSLSFVIPSLMSAIYKLEFFKPRYLYAICLGYAIIGNLVCLILGLITVDKKFDHPIEDKESETPSSDSTSSDSTSSCESLEVENKTEGTKGLGTKIKNAIKHPQMPEYLGVVLCASLFLTSIGFVNQSHREMLITSRNKSAVEIFKYMNILSFIPAPAFGKLIDVFGAGLVLVILHSTCLLYYFFASFDVHLLKVFACICYFFSSSLCISSTYCYINQRFPRKYFGVLVGFAFLMAGLTNLTNIPLYNLGSKTWMRYSPFNFTRISYILIAYMFVCLVTSSCLYLYRKERPEIEDEDLEEGVL